MKRKEIVYQRDITDCGPCCILSILYHYNGYVPLEKIRLDTYANEWGTNAYNLIAALNSYGFESTGIKMSNIEDISVLPAIVHLNLENGLSHFVVIYEIKNNEIKIMDPAKGKIIIPKEKFLELWDNIVIIIHPKQKIIKYPVQKNILHFFINLLLKEKQKYFVIMIFSLIITFLSLIISLFFRIINNINNQNIIFIMTIIFIIMAILKEVIYLIYNQKQIDLSDKIHYQTVSMFVKHIFSLPSTILHNRNPIDVITRIKDLDEIKDFLCESLISSSIDMMIIVITSILIFVNNPKLWSILLIETILFITIELFFAPKESEKIYSWINDYSFYNATLNDSFMMLNSINNLQIEDEITKELSNNLERKITSDKKLKIFLGKIASLRNLILDISNIIITVIVIININIGKENYISYIIFILLLNSYLESLCNLTKLIPEYYYLKSTFYKLSEFLAIPTNFSSIEEKYSKGDIKINNLSVKINNNFIFQNLNINFKDNNNYFLTGKSGSGKSTLLNIICGNEKNYIGNIYLNNKNYLKYNLNDLKKHISITNQNERLFSGSIYDNIICYRQVSKDNFKKVCQICKLDQIVSKLPLKYNSHINNNSQNFSGGEKQRIILARNLLKTFDILIIDEGLSEVDIKTEKEIIQNIKSSYKNILFIYVSHKELLSSFDNHIKI